jgi:hypothetical protein
MNIEKFVSLRPFLYHLTDKRNLDSILSDRTLRSTEHLARISNLEDADKFLKTRRAVHAQISNGNNTYYIRDQKPFSVTIVKKALEKDCTVEDFLFLLNTKVFFWAKLGDLQSHYNRYKKEGENPIIFRIMTQELFALNKPAKFCRLNSGGPRCSAYLGGKGAERGYNTFQNARDFDASASSVKEVTFENECFLPDFLELGNEPDGPFKKV